MHKPKYKLGDRVKITRASTEGEHDLWMDSWNEEMDYTIGMVVTIKIVNEMHKNSAKFCKYRFVEISFNYPEFVLEPEISVSVGEQLKFDFMNL